MNTKRIRTWGKLTWIALLAVSVCMPATAWGQSTKKVLVVTVTKGFRHSSIPTAEKVLASLAQESRAFSVDFVRDQKGDEDDQRLKEMTTPEKLAQYDGVIFANTTGDLPLADREAFLDWLKSGKAFVGMHSASDTFHGYPPFIDMIGGEFRTHGAQVTVDCINQDPNHPACRHLDETYTLKDEIYLFKNFHRDRVHGLLTLDQHPNEGTPGDYPVAWCKNYGEGRVFYTSLGHREDVWESETYQKHILGAIKWALGLAEGNAEPQSTALKLNPKEIRAGFRPLFNGVDLKGWRLRRPDGNPSWSAQNGMLVNVPGDHGTDLITEEEFGDFTVRYEYMVPEGSNSGFYLRGRYEIQILDDYDSKRTRRGGNGAIYSVKAPSKFVSRPPGKWQQAEVTIQGNRITVVMNGEKIHDAVEVNRATGGELDEELGTPGPILLQGNHGAVAFRNVRIKPLN